MVAQSSICLFFKTFFCRCLLQVLFVVLLFGVPLTSQAECMIEDEQKQFEQMQQLAKKLEKFVAHTNRLHEAYLAELESLKWNGLLSSDRLGKDTELHESRLMVESAQAAIKNAVSGVDQEIDLLEAEFNKLSLCEFARNVMASGIDESVLKKEKEIWRLEEKSVALSAQAIEILQQSLGRWSLSGGDLQFDNDSDFEQYQEVMSGFQRWEKEWGALWGLVDREYDFSEGVIQIPAGFDGPVGMAPQDDWSTTAFVRSHEDNTGTLLQITLWESGSLIPLWTDKALQFASRRYLLDNLQGIKRARVDFEQDEVEYLSIAGTPAARIKWRGSRGGIPLHGVMYCLVKNSTVIFFHSQDAVEYQGVYVAQAVQAFEQVQLK